VLLYAVISLSYSLWLKPYPLLDVFILSALYCIRVVAGGAASHHYATLWLLAFSGFSFLSLALVKRCAELPKWNPAHEPRGAVGRGYTSRDRDLLAMFGIASAFSSGVVLALFVGSATALEHYRSPDLLQGLVPLVLFWQCRLWLSTERGFMQDDPIVFAARDWVSWIVASTAVAIVVAAAVFRFAI
jgi:4-hydroxybenzoate polyprenyltransferase